MVLSRLYGDLGYFGDFVFIVFGGLLYGAIFFGAIGFGAYDRDRDADVMAIANVRGRLLTYLLADLGGALGYLDLLIKGC